jgi:hypothetical protein
VQQLKRDPIGHNKGQDTGHLTDGEMKGDMSAYDLIEDDNRAQTSGTVRDITTRHSMGGLITQKILLCGRLGRSCLSLSWMTR